MVGETTFGKGTVQSLLDLNDYASADRPGLGQLKITMAQFFRVNGGSTQNRGVVPDIEVVNMPQDVARGIDALLERLKPGY